MANLYKTPANRLRQLPCRMIAENRPDHQGPDAAAPGFAGNRRALYREWVALSLAIPQKSEQRRAPPAHV
jgi:hypothetical protein